MYSAKDAASTSRAIAIVMLVSLSFRPANAQDAGPNPPLFLIDDFDWGTATLVITGSHETGKSISSFSMPNSPASFSGAEVTRSLSTISNALGGETDILLALTEYTPSSEASITASAIDGGAWIQSTSATKVQAYLSYDGIDFDGRVLQGSDGLGTDVTANGTASGVTVAFDNKGPETDAVVVMYSAPERSSLYVLDVPVAATDAFMPFEDFQPNGDGADFSDVQAIVLFIGSGGGAPGPVNLRVSHFGLAAGPFVPPPLSVEAQLLHEQAGARNGKLYFPDYWGTGPEALNGDANGRVAEDFLISEDGTVITEFEIDLDWTNSVDQGRPLNANLAFHADDGGHPGEVIQEFPLIPFSRTANPFILPVPGGAPLAEGRYWFSFEAVTVPPYDVAVYASDEEFDFDAHYQNPGDFLKTGCRTYTSFDVCNSGGHSFGFKLYGILDEQAFADVGVTTALEDTTLFIGDTLTVSTRVTNNGTVDSPKTDIGLGVGTRNPTEITASQGSCALEPEEKIEASVVSCNLGLLHPGESALVRISWVVNKVRTVYSTSFFKPGDFPDQVPLNNVSRTSTYVQNRLVVKKIAPNDLYLNGKTIPFEIRVRNQSDKTVAGVEIRDIYPLINLSPILPSDCLVPTASAKYGTVVCILGSLGPGEEKIVDLEFMTGDTTSTRDDQVNRVVAVSSLGEEGRDETEFRVENLTESEALLWYFRGEHPSRGRKRLDDPVDVYLNDVLLADDISLGESTPFETVTLTEYPFFLYLVPGDAPDRSSAFDTIRVELSGVEQGLRSAIMLVDDETGGGYAVVLDDARSEASDPGHVDLAVLHAAPGLPVLNVELTTGPEATAIANGFEFGETSDYVEIETPGSYNLTVSPDGDPESAEVFGLELTTPGEAYMIVIATGGVSGKLDGIAVYAIDSQGNVVQPAVVTGTEASDPAVPASFALHGNYPNPFNPTTTIQYDVPVATEVSVAVYDALGRHVSALRTAHSAPGSHTVVWDAGGLPSGIYFVRMEAGDFVETRKMVLLK